MGTTTSTRRAVLGCLTAASFVGVDVLTVAPQSQDGELIRLHAEFERLLAEYNAFPAGAELDDHWVTIDAVNAKIRAIPAQTVDGLIVKALITRWDTNLDPDPTTPREGWDWDVKCFRLAHSRASTLWRREGSTMKTLTDVQDELSVVRNFIECAFMACSDLSLEHAKPLAAVLDAASSRLKEIDDAIEVIGQGSGARLKETKP